MTTMADARPNNFDRPGLSRLMPCDRCGHDEHLLHCRALISEAHQVLCPCRPAPIPGHPPLTRSPG